MYKYLFGPVPSRRLGMSLGIDLVPFKTCSFDCIYCECGKTTLKTTERKEYISTFDVLEELDYFMEQQPKLDYITFSGSGEPTLGSNIGTIIKYISKVWSECKIAVLTNGSLLSDEHLRHELMNANVVIPSLDAATPSIFKKINRPEKSLEIENIVSGLVKFRNEYKGQIWLEIFIVPGLNNSHKELDVLKKQIENINPEKIQLNSLDRPGTVKNLSSATNNQLKQIMDYWMLPNVEIITHANTAPELTDAKGSVHIENRILEIISRRPCTVTDLATALSISENAIKRLIKKLLFEKVITASELSRGTFFSKQK